MYIQVGKTTPGPVSWVLVVVALFAFLLSLFHGLFGPIGLSMVALGVAAAILIAKRSRGIHHPSLTEELRKPSPHARDTHEHSQR
jgi:hypothetical protein